MKKYDKKATNPFLKAQYAYNPFKSIYEQTYIWVEKQKDEKDENCLYYRPENRIRRDAEQNAGCRHERDASELLPR